MISSLERTLSTSSASLAPSPRLVPENSVDLLPLPAADALTALLQDSDPGARVAAFAMLAAKQRRDSARAAKDACDAAQASALTEERKQSRGASTSRFLSGILEGSFKLASAGASFAAIGPTVEARRTQNLLESHSANATEPLLEKQAMLQSRGDAWAAGSRAFDAGSTLGPAVGRFASDRSEARANEARANAERLATLAEDYGRDVEDAQESLTKCLRFLDDWRASKNGAMSAALHRA
jgi:hypothetical protein